MIVPSEIYSEISYGGGVITTARANEMGISNERLRLLKNSGAIECVSHGIYTFPNVLTDELYFLQLRRNKSIYSHETALFLNKLIPREPSIRSFTFPTGYNITKFRKSNVKAYTVKSDLHERGMISLMTNQGNTVRAYCAERSLCDCIRSRRTVNIKLFKIAMKRYIEGKNRDIELLEKIAEEFHVRKILEFYLEVLL